MALPHLKMVASSKLNNGTMLLALSGWMDGGMVSSGTVKGLMQNRAVVEIARIDPDPFFIYNFPGSMDIAALFRPQVKYEDGMITELDMPENVFSCDSELNLIFFTG